MQYGEMFQNEDHNEHIVIWMIFFWLLFKKFKWSKIEWKKPGHTKHEFYFNDFDPFTELSQIHFLVCNPTQYTLWVCWMQIMFKRQKYVNLNKSVRHHMNKIFLKVVLDKYLGILGCTKFFFFFQYNWKSFV